MAASVRVRHRYTYTCMDACGIGTRAATMQGSAGVEALRVPCTLRTTCVGVVCSQRPLGLDNGPSDAAHANSGRTLAGEVIVVTCDGVHWSRAAFIVREAGDL